MIRPLLFAAAALASGPAAAQPAPPPANVPKPRCEVLSIPELPVCVESPGGLVYAPDRAEAERNAAHAAAGEARFRRYFDRAPPPYAMVVGRLTPELQGRFRQVGIHAVLPWLTAEQQTAAHKDALRRAAEAQAKATGLDAAGAAALLQQMEQRGGASLLERNAAVVPHELGHAWLIQSFWPAAVSDRAGHYGGPAPDWLDETAAILMEDERQANDRRDQFRMLYTGKAKGAISGRPDALPVFLSKDHPLKGMQQTQQMQAAAGAAGQPQIRVFTVRQGDGNTSAAALDGPRFYLQGRAWADFLIDRSGRPAIFAEIATALAAGRTFEQWLAAEGSRNGLGATLPETERLWATWLQARYGPAPA